MPLVHSFDLTKAALDPLITAVRASAVSEFDVNGNLVTYGNNVWPVAYDPVTLANIGRKPEETRTETIRNNTMVGAAVGSPGTLPTNWAFDASAAGLAWSVVAVGTENGIDYIDLRLQGTTTASGGFGVAFESAIATTAASGQTWTGSVFARLIAGSLPGTGISIALVERNSGGGLLTAWLTSIAPTNAALRTQRFSGTATYGNASTARTNFKVQSPVAVASGVAIDFTIRIGLPSLQKAAFVTSPIRTSGVQLTRAALVATSDVSGLMDPNSDVSIVGSGRTAAGNGTVNEEVVALTDGTLSNRIDLKRNPTGRMQVGVVTGGVAQWNFQLGPAGDFGSNKDFQFFLAVANTDFAAQVIGQTEATQASGTKPGGWTTLEFGTLTGVNQSNGSLSRIDLYDERLPSTTAAALAAAMPGLVYAAANQNVPPFGQAGALAAIAGLSGDQLMPAFAQDAAAAALVGISGDQLVPDFGQESSGFLLAPAAPERTLKVRDRRTVFVKESRTVLIKEKRTMP